MQNTISIPDISCDMHFINFIFIGCRIGANAVVCKNCEEENSTLVGVPAKNVTVL